MWNPDWRTAGQLKLQGGPTFGTSPPSTLQSALPRCGAASGSKLKTIGTWPCKERMANRIVGQPASGLGSSSLCCLFCSARMLQLFCTGLVLKVPPRWYRSDRWIATCVLDHQMSRLPCLQYRFHLPIPYHLLGEPSQALGIRPSLTITARYLLRLSCNCRF